MCVPTFDIQMSYRFQCLSEVYNVLFFFLVSGKLQVSFLRRCCQQVVGNVQQTIMFRLITLAHLRFVTRGHHYVFHSVKTK